MADRPDRDQAIDILTQITESEVALTADSLLLDTDLDSLDILEWMFELGVEADTLLEDENFISSLDAMTLGQLYDLLMTAAADDAGQPSDEPSLAS
jgi:acyl carrier protein